MIEADLRSLKKTKPHEYATRFLFGGLATVLAGLIAKHFGPAAGGLFLAFPAIFPAGASLIEAHEKERKSEIGRDGTTRGRLAASLDASGATLGCAGLAVFAIAVWRGLPKSNPTLVIAIAATAWLSVSTALWAIRRFRIFHQKG